MTVNVTVAMDWFRFLLLPKSIFVFDRSCNRFYLQEKLLPEACPNPVRWRAEMLQLLMCRQGRLRTWAWFVPLKLETLNLSQRVSHLIV